MEDNHRLWTNSTDVWLGLIVTEWVAYSPVGSGGGGGGGNPKKFHHHHHHWSAGPARIGHLMVPPLYSYITTKESPSLSLFLFILFSGNVCCCNARARWPSDIFNGQQTKQKKTMHHQPRDHHHASAFFQREKRERPPSILLLLAGYNHLY